MTRLVKNGLVVVCGLATAGLMAGAISLAGNDAQKSHYLPRVARGEAIAEDEASP